MQKRYRAYFNRKNEAPQVWSCDEGSQESEVNVIGFICHRGCEIESRYNGTKPNADSPSAWIEICANDMYLAGGIAHFVMYPADGRP